MPETTLTLPDQARLLAAVDATWPPAGMRDRDGWRLRRGGGGGKRVSAASALEPGTVPDIDAAIAGLADWDQPPLFRLAPGEEALDEALAARGFEVVDPVVIHVARAEEIDDGRDQTARVIRVACPLRILEEIWDAGGIGAARRAVMARAPGPATMLLARAGDHPVGAGFVAVDGDIAMVHAIEVAAHARRQGAGTLILRGAARFGREAGAGWLALAVTAGNAPANALYARLGMRVAARYHYRALPGALDG